MDEIKALKVVFDSEKKIKLIIDSKYNFTYSKTGSVKFDGRYKPKYFKKEVLNSYDSVELGNYRFFLFTKSFDIDETICYKSILKYFIEREFSRIEYIKQNIVLLENQLGQY